MEIVPPVRQFFDRLSATRSTESILKRMSLFQGVMGTDIRQIAEQAQIQRYDRDERLFSEDSKGQPLARVIAYTTGRFCESCAAYSGWNRA